MADAGVDLHLLQRVARHQDPAVTSRCLHSDTGAVSMPASRLTHVVRNAPKKPAPGLVDARRS
jgi:hypothetical protein